MNTISPIPPTRPAGPTGPTPPLKDILLFLLAASYVAAALLADYLGLFRWHLANGFDLYKFTAWFLIPFLCCIPWMDWGALGVLRLKRIDWLILLGAILLGAFSILVVPFVPVLKAAFPHIPAWYKGSYFRFQMIYNVSWVTGWEFLHRYVLLRAASKVSPRFGWLLVPLSETVYHLAWPTLVMPAGMLLFSLVATRWSLARNNALLPFIAHFAIETELLLFQIIG